MRFRLLGSVEVIGEDGRAIALAGEKERVLLATLVLCANQAVSAERLVDALWGEDPPATAPNALQVYVSKLRKKLSGAGASQALERTLSGGYLLHTKADEVDVARFEELVTSASGAPALVAAQLTEALALWRGPALADVDSDLLAGERRRLEELRLLALERRIDAELALGRHAELIAELEALVHAEPFKEGPRRQLMVALYRAGRQADALAAYREAREVLAEELGVDPGPELRALEVAILRQDPALDAPSVSVVVEPSRAGQPTGTVTLLMTDIESSTRLWEEHPEQMALALRRHDVLLRNAIEGNRGYVVKTMGDAFHAVFRTAEEAAAAAIEIQQLVANEAWPASTELRVRVAVHTGHCEERDGDYYGPAVNRVARLVAIGYGGQVLLSGTTAALLEDLPERRVALRDLGLHGLKDVGRPERVFQLTAPGLEANFPPLRSLDNPRLKHNIPVQTTSFVGRETEIADVISLLDRSRLVTLTGVGGSGKSRLALQVAAKVLEAFGDGVWFVELAPIADPELVAATVASALGVREEPGRPLVDTVITAISNRRLLVVLDNCEHVLDACPNFADLLVRSCPNLGLIVTSREPLGIDGEQLYRVPSLSLPEADEAPDPEVAINFDAVQLFVDRAKAHVSTFVLDQAQVSAVVSLCQRLDGMPLAIELAAAWVPSLSVADIETRLDDRFRLLTKGRRTALPRQQTLRALIDWSYDALTSKEQSLLRRLSVFAGGWDLQTCQSVCSSSGPAEPDVLGVMSSLVSKSLVQAEPTAEGLRYGLLETIRQYGAERLVEAGSRERRSTHSAHADVFLGFVERGAAELRGPEQVRWIDRLDQEYENIRSALSHLSELGRNHDVLRMCIALKRFWIRRGYVNEGLQLVDAALVQDDTEDRQLRAAALITAGRLANETRRVRRSQTFLTEALELARQADDAWLTSAALIQLAYASGDQGDYGSAVQLVDGAIEAAGRTNDLVMLGDAHLTRCNIPGPKDRSAARKDCLYAITLFSKASDPCGLADAELALAFLDLREGKLEAADARFRTVSRWARELKDDRLILTLHTFFGLIELLRGNTRSAIRKFKEGLRLAVRMGHRPVMFNNLIGLAGCASADADNERAAMLYGAASEWLNQVQIFLDPDLDALCEWDKRRLRKKMGESKFADSYEAGSKLTTSDAVQLAIE
jgi:predicted ATPase/DNA-binding SARP family transcriptional activator